MFTAPDEHMPYIIQLHIMSIQHREREREGGRERQTDRQTDKQRQTDRDRETDRLRE